MHDDPLAYNPGDLARHTAEDAKREIAKLKDRVAVMEEKLDEILRVLKLIVPPDVILKDWAAKQAEETIEETMRGLYKGR